VAPSQVGRYLNELEDHLDDLVEAALSAGTSADEARVVALGRIGSAETLAGAMLVRPDFRSWSARAPWLVLPGFALLALAGGYILSMLFLVGAVRGFGTVTAGHMMPPGWLPGSSRPLFGFDRFALPVLIGWCIAFAAARQRLSLTWPLASMIAVAVVGAGLVFSADWPATPRHWEISVGTPLFDPTLSIGWAEYASSVLGTLLCMLVPAGIAIRMHGGSAPIDPEGRSKCV